MHIQTLEQLLESKLLEGIIAVSEDGKHQVIADKPNQVYRCKNTETNEEFLLGSIRDVINILTK